jgi:hypothetical protein
MRSAPIRIATVLGVLAVAAGLALATQDGGAAPAPESVTSNGGRYVLRVQAPAGGFERGKPLSFTVRVADAADPSRARDDVALVVDADMPEHLHGTNRVPRVERRADGTFQVENLYLHMPGWWEVFLDVVEGPWTERAQMRVDLE